MKKLLAICLVLVMMFTFAACSDNTDDANVPVASSTDLQLFPDLADLPEFKGKGTVSAPGEMSDGSYSYFWVADTTVSDMQSYGKRFEKAGWTLDDSIDNYDENSIIYYTKDDQLVQLKFMSGSYFQVSVGTREAVSLI